MNQIIVNEDLAAPGLRVVRGPGWEWGNQDGGKGGIGTIASEPDDGWVSVCWDTGQTYTYRVGGEGRYDLAMYSPFKSTGLSLTNKQQKVQEARKAMSQSIERANSLIEKSNTKHGNSNTDRTGAIKIRRPVIKIQGTKR